MNAWWAYFWPVFAAGMVAGMIGGLIAFRRTAWQRTLAMGAAAALALALLWHGPLGAANRLTTAVERQVRFVLDDWEMGAVTARLQRAPLTRRLELSGQADSFQRGALVKLMKLVPGVRKASWSKQRAVPLFAEGVGAVLLGFLLGLMLAYLVERRRRYNAQWKW